MQQELLISIITVVFNSEQYLEKTILSILKQSYKKYEYIIIDGGSQDGTINIIKKYEDRISYWISEKDNGIYDAMNKGIQLAKGQIIGILNSGDLYTPNALEKVSELAKKHQNKKYMVITGAMSRFDENSNIKFTQKRTIAELHRDINLTMPLNHPATFVTKNIYQKIGSFNHEFKITGDYDFIFRVYYSQVADFIFTNTILASMSMGGVSERLDSLWIMAKEGIEIRKNQLNMAHNIILFLRSICIGYMRYILVTIIGHRAILIKQKIKQKK